MFISVLSRIGIVFAVIAVGFLARRFKVLNKEATDGLCRIAIQVTLPFLYFQTLATSLSRQLFLSIWSLPLFAIALTFLSFFLGWLAVRPLKLDSSRRSTFLFLATFPNYGFLAIPLVFALFGQEGLARVFMFNLGITLLYWTFGVGILQGFATKDLKIFKNLLNSATLALTLGLIVGVSSIRLPQFILEVSGLIGKATIPLALIVVGSMLVRTNASQSFPFKPIAALAFCRLILLPALVLLLLSIFDGLPNLLRAIIMLQAAMPCASTTPIMTRRFGADTEFAASGVFFTTLLSMITVPLFLSLALR